MLDRIEPTIRNILVEIKLPEEKRQRLHADFFQRLSDIKKLSQPGGAIENMRMQLDDEIEERAKLLATDLQSETNFLYKALKETDIRTKRLRDVKSFVRNTLARAISESRHIDEIYTWSRVHLGEDVDDQSHRLGILRSKIFTLRSEIFSEKPSLASLSAQTDEEDFSPGLIPVVGSIQPGLEFRDAVSSTYKQTVNELCVETPNHLQEVFKRAVLSSRRNAIERFIYRDFDRTVFATEEELNARRRICQERDDLSSVEILYENFRKAAGKVSSFILELGVEDLTEADLTLPSPLNATEGQFGTVYKAQLATGQYVALKVPTEAINDDTAEYLLREILTSR